MCNRRDMKTIQDSHTPIRDRRRKPDARTLPEEDRDEESHLDHDEVGCYAGPCAGGEGLEFILDQGFAL